MKPIVWFLTLLSLFCAPNLASAYYDPGAQRWVNRDPYDELVFMRAPTVLQNESYGVRNLYLFVQNDPVVYTDSLGLMLTDENCSATHPHFPDVNPVKFCQDACWGFGGVCAMACAKIPSPWLQGACIFACGATANRCADLCTLLPTKQSSSEK
jgi:RHS repeat-associated protein